MTLVECMLWLLCPWVLTVAPSGDTLNRWLPRTWPWGGFLPVERVRESSEVSKAPLGLVRARWLCVYLHGTTGCTFSKRYVWCSFINVLSIPDGHGRLNAGPGWAWVELCLRRRGVMEGPGHGLAEGWRAGALVVDLVPPFLRTLHFIPCLFMLILRCVVTLFFLFLVSRWFFLNKTGLLTCHGSGHFEGSKKLIVSEKFKTQVGADGSLNSSHWILLLPKLWGASQHYL